MIDKNLFEYLTKKSGHTFQDVADLWGVPLSGVYKRMNGIIELRQSEMESWMNMVGARDAGPVFFPRIVADMQHNGVPTPGVQYGG
ncbi:MAG: hypothetical protein ACI4P4_03750 [Faecousia sp.]